MDAAGAFVVHVEHSDGSRPRYLVQPGGRTIPVPVPPAATGQYPHIVAMSADGRRLTGQLVTGQGVPTTRPMTWACF